MEHDAAARPGRLRGLGGGEPLKRLEGYRRDRIYWFATPLRQYHSLIMVGVLLSTARKLALKIASYGVMHLVVAILVAFAITRDWRLALAVGMVEPFFQTIAYSIHDRIWHRIEQRRMLSGVEEASTFWAAGGLFILAALAIAFLRVGNLGKEARNLAEQMGEKSDRSLRVGFQVLWRDKLLRTITISILIIAAVYLPTETVVLSTYFEGLDQPASLGIVISALAAGSAVGSFGYGWISARLSRKNLVRTTLIGTAVSILPMAFLPPLPILIVAGFFLGLSWGPFNPLVSTLIQQRVPADQQGRVFGVQTAVFYAAPPLGMVLAGLSVESFGVSTTYIVLAAILSVTAILALLTKSLRSSF